MSRRIEQELGELSSAALKQIVSNGNIKLGKKKAKTDMAKAIVEHYGPAICEKQARGADEEVADMHGEGGRDYSVEEEETDFWMPPALRTDVDLAKTAHPLK